MRIEVSLAEVIQYLFCRSEPQTFSEEDSMRVGRVVLMGVWCTYAISGAAVAQDQVTAPTYRVGDSWVYTSEDKMNRATGLVKVTETVTAVSEKGFETSVEGDPRESQSRRYTAELNTVRAFGFDYAPMIPNFSFPLTVGKQWQGQYTFFNPGVGGQVNGSQQVRVEGWEEIKVPAGTFKALKISISRTLESAPMGAGGRRGTRPFQVTFWYSPEVRWFVRREIRSAAFVDDTAELVSFKRAQ